MSETTDLVATGAQDAAGSTEAPAASGTTGSPRRRGNGLSGMLLPELQRLAAELGISGTGRMRKGDLVAAEPAEPLDQSRQVEPREAGLDHESSRVAGVPRPVQQDDRAAHRATHQHRALQFERQPHRADDIEIGSGGEPIARRPPAVRRIAASVPRQIERDHPEAGGNLGIAQHMPELAGVFRLGEYMDPGFPSLLGSNPGLGRHVVLYYGSFKVLAQGDPGFDWEEQIWETLVHELRHHLESLSGRDDLIQEDTAFLQRLRRERPARGSKDC